MPKPKEHGEEAVVERVYVDYDDPMTSKLQEVKKQQAFVTKKTEISYDDLF